MHDILEQQQQNMLISQKERSRDRAAAGYSSKGAEEKGKDCRSGTSKSSCSKGGKSSFEHDTAKKGKSKGNRSRGLGKERQFRRKTNTPQRGKSPSGKEDFRVSTANEEIVVMIESEIIGISPHCKYCKKDVTWRRIVRSSTPKEESIYPSSTKRQT